MTTSEQIRSLARDGVSTAEIARRLGIRYQHAYNVLHNSGPGTPKLAHKPLIVVKPPLIPSALLDGGFKLSSRWTQSETSQLILDRPIERGRRIRLRKRGGRALRRRSDNGPRQTAVFLREARA